MAIGVTPYRRFNAVINSSGITGASNLTGTSTFDVDIEDEGGFVRLDQVLLLDSDIPHSHYELVGVECQFNQTSTNPNPLSSIRIQIFSNSPSVVFHFDQILFINQINALKSIKITKYKISIGSLVTYSDFQDFIISYFPNLIEYINRIGGDQIRNMGTIGGNIANGSPIGDIAPLLISLGGKMQISSKEKSKKIYDERIY